MTGESGASGVSRGARLAVAGVLASALLAGALAWHAKARAAFSASQTTGIPPRTRYHHAYTAAALEPWNGAHAARKRVVTAWLRADALLAAGDYQDAVTLLSATVGRTLAEPDLLALYRRAQEIESLDTNRKAHLQHGHEGPGGTLRPRDIER